MQKLADLVDHAARNNAYYIAFFGQMFGQERVSESVINSLFAAAKENPRIQMLVFHSSGGHRIGFGLN